MEVDTTIPSRLHDFDANSAPASSEKKGGGARIAVYALLVLALVAAVYFLKGR